MVNDKKHNIIDFKAGRKKTKEQVLEELYNEHWSHLCTFVRARLGSSDDIYDIAQEVFLRLADLDNLQDKLEATGGNRAYLFTIANNLIVDNERRKIMKFNYDLQYAKHLNVQDITPETIISAERELEIFKQVIKKMRPNWRQAFVLSRFKFLSYTQIAEHMGVTLKQVEGYMAQALMRIRDAQSAIKKTKTKVTHNLSKSEQ